MWGELVRVGGSEDSHISQVGIYFGTTHDQNEEVFCGRMQPTAKELQERGYTHSPESQTVLALNYISATHFAIERTIEKVGGQGRYFLTDRSRNGTIVNGENLVNGQRIEIKEGAVVGFKFKNDVKLEYVWTTTESGFRERRDKDSNSEANIAAPEVVAAPTTVPSDVIAAEVGERTIPTSEVVPPEEKGEDEEVKSESNVTAMDVVAKGGDDERSSSTEGGDGSSSQSNSNAVAASVSVNGSVNAIESGSGQANKKTTTPDANPRDPSSSRSGRSGSNGNVGSFAESQLCLLYTSPSPRD